jgi:ABC-type polysaccharide transport system permease subunit
MHIVTFVVALIFCLPAAIIFSYGLAQLAKNKPQARNTLVTGFGLWLSGIVLAAILFVFFSL